MDNSNLTAAYSKPTHTAPTEEGKVIRLSQRPLPLSPHGIMIEAMASSNHKQVHRNESNIYEEIPDYPPQFPREEDFSIKLARNSSEEKLKSTHRRFTADGDTPMPNSDVCD